jgi:hypothetical protein
MYRQYLPAHGDIRRRYCSLMRPAARWFERMEDAPIGRARPAQRPLVGDGPPRCIAAVHGLRRLELDGDGLAPSLRAGDRDLRERRSWLW